MDKLKQNAYWIAVGGTGLGLLALIYVLVLLPLSSLGEEQTKLNSSIERMEKTAKAKFIPTTEYLKYLEEKESADKEVEQKGREFYDVQGKKFDQFFDDADAAPSAADFSAKYKDELDKLIQAYREKNKIVPDETNPDQTPPKVMRIVETLDEAKVPMAMKEFWIIQDVFGAVNKLELGGLLAVNFSGREVESKETLPFNKWVSTTIQIEMPFARVEDLLTELYSSERVLFQLEELTFHKTSAGVGKFVAMDQPLNFKDLEEANKATPAVDPTVMVEMSLSAFDWTGAPELKEEAPPKEDEPAKSPKPKTGKGKAKA